MLEKEQSDRPEKKAAGGGKTNLIIAVVAVLLVVMLVVFSWGINGKIPSGSSSSSDSPAYGAASSAAPAAGSESAGTSSLQTQLESGVPKAQGAPEADTVTSEVLVGGSSDTDSEPAGSGSSGSDGSSSASPDAGSSEASSPSSGGDFLSGLLPSDDGDSAQAAGPDDFSGSKVSRQEFDTLTTGMSYSDVVSAVGGTGKLTNQSGNLQIYVWSGYGSESATVQIEFKSGALYRKYQFGL
jgi:hypothetical protein